MTREELLLNQIELWWDCISGSELEEGLEDGLEGEGATDPADVREHYPNYGSEDDDGNTVEQIKKDANALFGKLRTLLQNEGKREPLTIIA